MPPPLNNESNPSSSVASSDEERDSNVVITPPPETYSLIGKGVSKHRRVEKSKINVPTTKKQVNCLAY